MLRTIGLMSGTSLDGVDAAWVETDGERIGRIGPALTLPYAPALRRDLRRLLDIAGDIGPEDPFLADCVARLAIEAAGARLLYLPPYSPDFNPIENAFAKLKAILRKAAARTIDGLWEAIRDALPRFTPDECRNYFTAAGYEPD